MRNIRWHLKNKQLKNMKDKSFKDNILISEQQTQVTDLLNELADLKR